MSATDMLIRKALDLPDGERYRLLEALLESFPDDDADGPAQDAEWSAELKRRGDEMDNDPSAGFSLTEVRQRMQVELDAMKSESHP